MIFFSKDDDDAQILFKIHVPIQARESLKITGGEIDIGLAT